MDKKIYGLADKAWQVVVGCDPRMPCAPRCWARKTVARIVRCQEKEHSDRAAFFQIALTPDGKQWSGQTFLDETHLADPLKWRKPALIATGFHGDLFRLSGGNIMRVMNVAARADWHTFLFLTKCSNLALEWATRWSDTAESDYEPKLARGPEAVRKVHTCGRAMLFADMLDAMGKPPAGCAYPLYDWMEGMCRWPDRFHHISIGCSIMDQVAADAQRPAMAALAALGWSTHVWYEPAIGRVNWQGWEFIKLLIVGGETGANPRPFVDNWAYVSLDWCQQHGIKFWMKQLGANPVDSLGKMRGTMFLKTDRSGSRLESLPGLLRVRELPETFRRATAEVPR